MCLSMYASTRCLCWTVHWYHNDFSLGIYVLELLPLRRCFGCKYLIFLCTRWQFYLYLFCYTFRKCHEWSAAPVSTCLCFGPCSYFCNESCICQWQHELFPCTTHKVGQGDLSRNQTQSTSFGSTCSTNCGWHLSHIFCLLHCNQLVNNSFHNIYKCTHRAIVRECN